MRVTVAHVDPNVVAVLELVADSSRRLDPRAILAQHALVRTGSWSRVHRVASGQGYGKTLPREGCRSCFSRAAWQGCWAGLLGRPLRTKAGYGAPLE